VSQTVVRDPTPLHVRKAVELLGVVERPWASNRGEPIDTWRRSFNIVEPVPWCGIYASVASRRGHVTEPYVHSSIAREFVVRGHSRRLSDVIYGRFVPRPGDYRVKTRRGGNHVDIIVSWDDDAQEGLLIGGNVGHAVSLRRFSLRSMMADGTTHITRVKGFHNYLASPFDVRALGEAASNAASED
jgi:hypothetical protein